MNEKKNLLPLKIDLSKCHKVATYAKMMRISPPTVYARIKEGKIRTVEIDGEMFVYTGVTYPPPS